MDQPIAPQPLLRLRPLGVGELLDEAFRLYRRHFWLLVALALMPIVLPTALELLGLGGTLSYMTMLSTTRPGQVPTVPPVNVGLLALAVLLFWALAPFSTGLIQRAAIGATIGEALSVGLVLKAVARRYWGLMGVLVIPPVVFLLLSVTVVGIFFAIWILGRWSMAVPALLAEGVGPGRALGRSWALVRGSWWRVVGIFFLVLLLLGFMSGVVGAILSAIAVLVPLGSLDVRLVFSAVVRVIVLALLLPIQYLCWVLVYFDLRIRKESFDLDMLARQAGS